MARPCRSFSGNVLLDAKILSVSREASGTRLVPHTDLGLQSIVAKQVIIAIPPIEHNLDFLDMDEKESTVVQQFEHSYLYAALVTVDRLAASYFNWKTDAPYGLLKLPAIYSIRIIDRIDHLALVHFGSDTHLEDKEAKTLILNQLLRLRTIGVSISDPEMVAFANHSPYQLRVSQGRSQKDSMTNLMHFRVIGGHTGSGLHLKLMIQRRSDDSQTNCYRTC